MAITILAVDDMPEMRELLKRVLGKQGYIVRTAKTATEAAHSIAQQKPDLILLDIILPDTSGINLTAQLKSSDKYSDIPIILLTAKDSDSDVVLGLKKGADDYIVKPIKPDILNARIEAVLRRYNPDGIKGKSMLSVGAISILPDFNYVAVDSEPVEMTVAEYNILLKLVEAKGEVLSRDELLDALDNDANPRVVDTHIAVIRKKLGNARKHIRTVHNKGYKILPTR